MKILFCIFVIYFTRGNFSLVKFMFSKKTTKIDKILSVDLTLCKKCQIEIFLVLENTNFNLVHLPWIHEPLYPQVNTLLGFVGDELATMVKTI